MDRIGKIDAGSAGGQVDDIALGGKGKHFLRQQVALEVVQQIAGILADALVFQQLAHPCQTFVQLVVAIQTFFILPVGRNAVLGLLVHLAGADLHLKGDALVADDGGVQALVAIGLGSGDIVLEAVGQRMVHIVDEAQSAVALGQRIQNDTHRIDVVDLIKGLVLHDGLAIDAVNALDAALDGSALNAAFGQPPLDHTGHLCKELLACTLTEHPADLLVAHRVKVMQAAVFQLFLHIQDAQTVGNRGIHLHGLAGFIAALLFRPCITGAHIVQPVAQLNDHHAHIAAHGQQHLAQVFSLQFLNVRELDLGQLGHAVHQQGNFLAKGGFQVVQCSGSVLHHIVQQGRSNALGVHTKIQHQPCHSQRMADIRLAAAAAHPLVGSVGKVICLFDHLHIVGAATGLDGLTQLFPGNDLRPHLRRQRAFRGIGQLCCCRNGSRFLHRYRLMQVGLCGVEIFFPHRLGCRDRSFLSLWHFTFPPNISGSGHPQGSFCPAQAQAPDILPHPFPQRRSGPPVPEP